MEEKLFSSFKNLDTNAKEDILVSFVNSEILDQYVLLSLKTNFINLSNENKEKVSKILIKELELQYIKQKEEESKYNETLKKHQEQNTFYGSPSISTDNELRSINIIDILILNYNSLDNTSKLYIDNILTNKSRINSYFKSLLIYFDFLPLEITKNISSIIENDKKLTSLLHESYLYSDLKNNNLSDQAILLIVKGIENYSEDDISQLILTLHKYDSLPLKIKCALDKKLKDENLVKLLLSYYPINGFPSTVQKKLLEK